VGVSLAELASLETTCSSCSLPWALGTGPESPGDAVSTRWSRSLLRRGADPVDEGYTAVVRPMRI
jgi:hypothetical protein